MTALRVIQETQRIVVNTATFSFAIVSAGPPGPPGPPGANGTAIHYDYTQAVAASSWVINHNLGYKPNYTVEAEDGTDIEPAVIHHSINQIELQFNVPRAGVAHLS